MLTKSEKTSPSERAVSWLLWIALLLAFVGMLCAGCTNTITPPVATPRQASFDGNQQNSGILSFSDAGAVCTVNAKARYDALVLKFGARFNPPLVSGPGWQSWTNGTWLVDKQHVGYWQQMADWNRNPKP